MIRNHEARFEGLIADVYKWGVATIDWADLYRIAGRVNGRLSKTVYRELASRWEEACKLYHIPVTPLSTLATSTGLAVMREPYNDETKKTLAEQV